MFQDEYGDFPAGTHAIRHRPRIRLGQAGCTIFVKLWQFDSNDRNQFPLMTEDLPPPVDGVATATLHEDAQGCL